MLFLCRSKRKRRSRKLKSEFSLSSEYVLEMTLVRCRTPAIGFTFCQHVPQGQEDVGPGFRGGPHRSDGPLQERHADPELQ